MAISLGSRLPSTTSRVESCSDTSSTFGAIAASAFKLLNAALAALPLASAAAAATAATALVEESVVEVLRAVPESVHVGHARDTDHVLVLGTVSLDTVAEGLDLVTALLLELLETENPARVSGCGPIRKYAAVRDER